MGCAEDRDFLEVALREPRVSITLDHDFHRHLALAQSIGPSVIFIRIERLATEAQAALIRHICDTYSDALERGSAITVDSRTVRIRKLPLR